MTTTITLENFCRLWPKAQKNGWYLGNFDNSRGPLKSPIHLTVHPPRNSEMARNFWAATYVSLDFGGVPILIPHWFETTVTQ